MGYAATQPHQLLSVDGLFFHLYAFRQSGNSVESASDLVPLHQVGPSRTKKDTQPPELLPVSNGMDWTIGVVLMHNRHRSI